MEGGVFLEKSKYINTINEECRVAKKSKKSIHVEGGNVCGGWIFFSKSIRVTPRLLERWEYIYDKMSLQKWFFPYVSGKSKPSRQSASRPISTTSQLQSVLIINSSTLIAEQTATVAHRSNRAFLSWVPRCRGCTMGKLWIDIRYSFLIILEKDKRACITLHPIQLPIVVFLDTIDIKDLWLQMDRIAVNGRIIY